MVGRVRCLVPRLHQGHIGSQLAPPDLLRRAAVVAARPAEPTEHRRRWRNGRVAHRTGARVGEEERNQGGECAHSFPRWAWTPWQVFFASSVMIRLRALESGVEVAWKTASVTTERIRVNSAYSSSLLPKTAP